MSAVTVRGARRRVRRCPVGGGRPGGREHDRRRDRGRRHVALRGDRGPRGRAAQRDEANPSRSWPLTRPAAWTRSPPGSRSTSPPRSTRYRVRPRTADLWDAAFGGGAAEPVVTVDQEALAAEVALLAETLAVPAVDGTVVFADGEAHATPAANGYTVDTDEAARRIADGWLVAPEPLDLPVAATAPTVTQEMTRRRARAGAHARLRAGHGDRRGTGGPAGPPT